MVRDKTIRQFDNESKIDVWQLHIHESYIRYLF